METSTTASEEPTIEQLEEAIALITKLAPKHAPDDVTLIGTLSGLQIYKNDMMPDNAIVVGSRLFNIIYENSENKKPHPDR